MSDKLDEITRQRKRAHAKLIALDSKVYKAFVKMEAATYRDGALLKKEKELIAVGISVVIDCESCMQWHIEQAARAGATMPEVRPGDRFGTVRAGRDGERFRGLTVGLWRKSATMARLYEPT